MFNCSTLFLIRSYCYLTDSVTLCIISLWTLSSLESSKHIEVKGSFCVLYYYNPSIPTLTPTSTPSPKVQSVSFYDYPLQRYSPF